VAAQRLGPAQAPPRPALALLTAVALLASLAAAGCGSATRAHQAHQAPGGIPAALARESRPIGRGPAFAPAATGPVLGPCRPGLGRRVGVHVEVFAANRVVLVAAGIGARSPLRRSEGRITGARCFGALVTLEPTGVVLVAPGARLTVSALFRSWGQPLSAHRLASFHGPVRVYVGGRRRPGSPAGVPLRPHAEIVLEVGPYVPPHSSYQFPPGS
jgi:hypothetical protein